jgi:hypothetical protein
MLAGLPRHRGSKNGQFTTSDWLSSLFLEAEYRITLNKRTGVRA